MFLIFVFSIFWDSDIFAFQFNNYKWGESYFILVNQIKAEKKGLIKNTEEKIVYKDNIFGKNCEISLYFTPKGRYLSFIQVVWPGTDKASEIRDILTRKYGAPHQQKAYVDIYVWFSDISEKKIVLDYASGEIKLKYYGGKYYTEYQKEMSRKYPAQAGRL
jgi:hypothetical protein